MIRKRIHKSSRKNSHGHGQGIERFLSYRLLNIIGAVFLLIGLYYSFSSSEGSTNLYNLFTNLLKPSKDVPIMEVEGKGLGILLFYFLPATLALILSSLYVRKLSSITYPASLIIVLYLIVIQTKISFINFNFGGCYYPTFFIASLFLLLPILLFFITAFLHRKSTLLILSCFYFYISVALYGGNYGVRFDYLFPFVLFFSIAVAWLSQKIERPFITLINLLFNLGFFGLFWLRKFVTNSKPDYLIEFFIFGILFYILFYAIGIYASNANHRPLRKWMQLVLTWSNLLFFLGTTSFVIIKYYSFGYLWIFVLALLLINLLGLYLLKRINANTWTLPHHYSILFLAALVLPLLLHQNMVLLFTGGLSVLMLGYANTFKEKAAIWISLLAMAVSIIDYLFLWMHSYLPALVGEKMLSDGVLLWQGLVSGLAVMGALAITQWILKDAEISLSKKWFSRSSYNRLIRGSFLFSLFLTMGWIGFSLLYQLTGTLISSTVVWFISGSIFFIFLINYYSGKQSTFKKPMLYLAFGFALLYPLLVHWSMIAYRENAVIMTSLRDSWWSGLSFLLLHYVALGLLVALGFTTIGRIYLRNSKYIVVQRGVKVLTIGFLIFLFCTEYDNISVFIASGQNGLNGVDKLLEFNQHLPYSILMWIIGVGVFVWGVFYHNGFLRGGSIVLFVGVLIKVFAYDFETINPGGRGAVFFVLGAFLIGFAVMYPRVVRGEAKVAENKGNVGV